MPHDDPLRALLARKGDPAPPSPDGLRVLLAQQAAADPLAKRRAEQNTAWLAAAGIPTPTPQTEGD